MRKGECRSTTTRRPAALDGEAAAGSGGAAGPVHLRCGLGEEAVRVGNPNRPLLYCGGAG
jgi:hypothetical protein